MAPTVDPMARRALEIGLVRAALVIVAVAAILIGAAIAFGWTLPAGPSFDLSSNPGVDLP